MLQRNILRTKTDERLKFGKFLYQHIFKKYIQASRSSIIAGTKQNKH